MSAPVSTSAPAVPTTTGGRPRLLLLDGHSLAYRAFFALPVENFSTTTGQPTNAVYGFTSMLINILRDEQPTHLAVAFDVGRTTFRSEIFADYKANRSESPTDFRGQVSLVQEVLAALHVPVITADNYEADDVIATLTVQAVEQGMDVLIATGDRDALQLVNDHVTVLYPRKGVSDMTRFTPEEVETKYGLSPAQYPDFAALRGDPSDNLPSIPSVGEKTAAKWVREYGSLDALVDQVDTVKGKVGEKLREHLSSVLQNRRLTELDRSVPLDLGPGDLAVQAWDRNEVHTLFDNLQFRVLRDRLFATLTSAEPEVEGGFDVAEDAVPAGGLGDWLQANARTGRTGLIFRGTWGRGTGELTGMALAAANDTRRSSTSAPSSTSPTSRPSPPGWPTRPPRRSCTRSRVPTSRSGRGAGSWRGWSATRRWPPTSRCPASGRSTSATSRSATSSGNSRTRPSPRGS
jgi:DNA polymerase-1